MVDASTDEDPAAQVTAVYVVGPSSSGKTTLCSAIANRLGLAEERFVREVARNVMKSTGFSRATVQNLEMQRAILVAQVEAEERALQSPSDVPFLLSDRSAVDPLVYAALGFEDGEKRQDELMQSEEFQKALARYRHSVFVLLLPVREWVVDDGVRSLDRPQECLDTFRATMRKLDIGAKEIGPELRELEARLDAVLTRCRDSNVNRVQ